MERGDLDVDTIEEVIQVIRTVVESCDPKSLPSVLRSKLINRYDEGDYVGVAEIGKNILSRCGVLREKGHDWWRVIGSRLRRG